MGLLSSILSGVGGLLSPAKGILGTATGGLDKLIPGLGKTLGKIAPAAAGLALSPVLGPLAPLAASLGGGLLGLGGQVVPPNQLRVPNAVDGLLPGLLAMLGGAPLGLPGAGSTVSNKLRSMAGLADIPGLRNLPASTLYQIADPSKPQSIGDLLSGLL